MKIGKITLEGFFNYGNLLQNYALQQVLLRYADTVENISHARINFLPQEFWHWTWKEWVKVVINYHDFRTNLLSGHIGLEMVRQGKLRDWSTRYIHTRNGVKNFSGIADEYD